MITIGDDEVEAIRVLLDKCADVVPGLRGDVARFKARLDELEAIEHPGSARDAEGFVGSFLGSIRRGRLSRSTGTGGPRWDYVAPAARRVKEIVDSEVRFLARVDGLGLYLRETLDALGLQITDEDVVYCLLVSAGLFVELTVNGHENDDQQVPSENVRYVSALAQTFTGALLPYMPEGVI